MNSHLEKVFEGKLDNVETLCTDTHRSYTAFAKSNNIDHQKFNASKGQRVKNKIYHVRNVNNTAKRLRTMCVCTEGFYIIQLSFKYFF